MQAMICVLGKTRARIVEREPGVSMHMHNRSLNTFSSVSISSDHRQSINLFTRYHAMARTVHGEKDRDWARKRVNWLTLVPLTNRVVSHECHKPL